MNTDAKVIYALDAFDASNTRIPFYIACTCSMPSVRSAAQSTVNAASVQFLKAGRPAVPAYVYSTYTHALAKAPESCAALRCAHSIGFGLRGHHHIDQSIACAPQPLFSIHARLTFSILSADSMQRCTSL